MRDAAAIFLDESQSSGIIRPALTPALPPLCPDPHPMRGSLTQLNESQGSRVGDRAWTRGLTSAKENLI